MSSSWPKKGLGNVSSYAISAVPYVTSSLAVPASNEEPTEVEFPNITRFIMVTNNLAGSSGNVPLRVGFSANGIKGVVNNNYFILNNQESFEGELRVSSVFLLSDSTTGVTASVVAGLTDIESSMLIDNYSGSAGVG